MIHQTGRQEIFAEELASLAEEVTELGILAVDAFKNAAATLFAPDPAVAYAAVQLATQSAATYQAIHRKTISMLARWAPAGDDLRRVVDLQRTALEWARIAEHGQRTAGHGAGFADTGTAEEILHWADAQAADTLVGLVRQVYVLLRGCLLLSATRDRALARRLVVEDAELERLYRQLKDVLERAIGTQPQRALPFHRLLFVLAELEQIGNHVVTICQDRLYVPPRSAGV
jgi:phosphate uptake regulator